MFIGDISFEMSSTEISSTEISSTEIMKLVYSFSLKNHHMAGSSYLRELSQGHTDFQFSEVFLFDVIFSLGFFSFIFVMISAKL